MSFRAQRVFATGHAILSSLVLATGIAIPFRHWSLLLPIGLMATLLVISSVAVFCKSRWATLSLRVASIALLLTGLLVIAGAVLTIAFLSGIHGQFLRNGIGLMLLTIAVTLPYLIVYPLVQLAWFARRDEGASV